MAKSKAAFLFYGSFIKKSDADKRAKQKGASVRRVKMRGRVRYQVFHKCG